MNTGSRTNQELSVARTDFWNSGPFLSLATAFIFASSSIAGKYASIELAPLAIVLIRSVLATGFLGGVAAKQGSAKFRIAIRHLLPICLMGWFGIVGYVYLFLSSLEHTSVANTAIIGSLAPVASALAAALFIGEKLSLKSYLGVVLACCGAVLLLSGGAFQEVTEFRFNRGDLLMLGAVGCSVAYGLIAKQLSHIYSATTLTFYMTVGAIGLLAAITDFQDIAEITDLSPRGWLAIAYMGIASSGIGYMLFNVTVRVIGPTRTSCSVYSATPVFVMLLAAWLFAEPITPISALSTILISSGLYLTLIKRA